MAKARTPGVAVPRAVIRERRAYTAIAVYAGFFTMLFLAHRTYLLAAYFGLATAILMCGRSVAAGHINGYIEATRDAAKAAEAEAERKVAAETPREIVINVTPSSLGEGFLYILKFNTDGVKVGQTLDLQRRLSQHRRDAAAYGVSITDYWISPAHVNYLDNEIELIGFCDGISAIRAKREYFHGIEFAEVVQFAAKSLIYYTGDPAVTGVDQ